MKFKILLGMFTVLLMFTSCKHKETIIEKEDKGNIELHQDEVDSIEEINIPIDVKDSLNPYKIKTNTNKVVSSLIYDGLIKTDENYIANYKIAKKITKTDGKITIQIYDNIKFTNGDSITAEDIKNSFDMAKDENSSYSYQLKYISNPQVTGTYSLTLDMKKDNILYKNLLTFPIIKKTPQGKIYGSGRYYIAKDSNNKCLLPNKNNHKNDYVVKRINLIKVNAGTSTKFKISTGELDLAYSNDGIFKQNSISVGYNNVDLNNLVYIGINNNSGYTANYDFRKAIDMALNKQNINSFAYSSQGVVTYSPFNPNFYQSKATRENITNANKILDELGYDKKNIDGFRTTSTGIMTLRIIVNEENKQRILLAQELKDELGNIGINLDIIEIPFNQYKQRLASNNYDLFVAEVGLTDDMDLSILLSPNSKTAFGVLADNPVLKSFESFLKGKIDKKVFVDEFNKNLPFIPITYRQGFIYYARNFSHNIVATHDDIFYNIINW